MPDEDEETLIELIMPFSVCKSNGGPYDDQSFVAGYETGALDHALKALVGFPFVLERWAFPELVPQLDLVAMKYDLKLKTYEMDASGEWIRCRIGHPGMVDDAG